MNILKLFLIKIAILITKLRGGGSAFPGLVSKKLNFNFRKIKNLKQKEIIYVIGTNGKTTTTNLIYQMLLANNKRVITNFEGANLINGIYTLILKHLHFNMELDSDIILLEVDEKTIKQIVDILPPNKILVTNFFRDQLDRYGEIDLIVDEILASIPKNTTLFLNGDDPYIYYKFKEFSNKIYYGINSLPEAINKLRLPENYNKLREIIYCPNCHCKLEYQYFHYGHLGKFNCPNCNNNIEIKYQLTQTKNGFILDNQEYQFDDLPFYYLFNIIASVSIIKSLDLSINILNDIIKEFKFPPGRNQNIIYKNQPVYLNLVKNVVGLEETLDYIENNFKKFNLLFCLNDNYADGKDISWIYDVDLDVLTNRSQKIFVTGTRAYDMALRFELNDYQGDIEVIEDPIDCLNAFFAKNDAIQKVIISNYTEIKNISDYLERG